MKVLAVARDMAPSDAFTRLFKCQTDSLEIKCLVGNGKPFQESTGQIKEQVGDADAVLLGMSSSPELSQEELAAGREAVILGKPIFLYADRFGTWSRPWFKELWPYVQCLFVINEQEAGKARALYPNNTEVVVSGNPIWEDFAFPTMSRPEVRNKLGIADDETFILVPGGKVLAINILLLDAVIEASLKLAPWKFRIIFTPHPGDQNDRKFYMEIFSFTCTDTVKAEIIEKDTMSSTVAVVGADLVVDSASTIGIQAAFIRTPAITFLNKVVLGRMLLIEGTQLWEPCELGVSQCVTNDLVMLASAIESLLTPSGFAEMRLCQEKKFPQPPEKGSACRIITESIKEVVSSN